MRTRARASSLGASGLVSSPRNVTDYEYRYSLLSEFGPVYLQHAPFAHTSATANRHLSLAMLAYDLTAPIPLPSDSGDGSAIRSSHRPLPNPRRGKEVS